MIKKIEMNFQQIIIYFLLVFFISCNNETENIEVIIENPALIASAAQEITLESVLINGEITKLGTYEVIDYGLVLAIQTPTINDHIISFGSLLNPTSFEGRFNNLQANTEYFFRSFVKIENGKIFYSKTLSFKTLEQTTWSLKSTNPNGPLTGAASFTIGNRFFIGTGFRNSYLNTFYEIDYLNDEWIPIANLPSHERANSISFSIDNYGYVGLGKNCTGQGLCTHNYFNDLWRYEAENNTWVKMADFPGDGRAYSTSFVIEKKAYVTNGSSGDHFDFWEYDSTTNSWSQKATYPGNCVSRGSSFAINNKGYVGFGWDDGTCFDFWEYDPENDVWTEKGNFPGDPRYSSFSFSLNGKGYVGGGINQSTQGSIFSYLQDIWVYEQSNDSWSKYPMDYPGKGTYEMISTIVNNHVIIGLGRQNIAAGEICDDLWAFYPD